MQTALLIMAFGRERTGSESLIAYLEQGKVRRIKGDFETNGGICYRSQSIAARDAAAQQRTLILLPKPEPLAQGLAALTSLRHAKPTRTIYLQSQMAADNISRLLYRASDNLKRASTTHKV